MDKSDNAMPSSSPSPPPQRSVGETASRRRPRQLPVVYSSEGESSESEKESSESTGSSAPSPPRKRRRLLADATPASLSQTKRIHAGTARFPNTPSKADSTPTGSQVRKNRSLSPSNSHDSGTATAEEDERQTTERGIQTSSQGSGDSGYSSSVAEEKGGPRVEIDVKDDIYSIAFLADGKHIVGCGKEKKIQRWDIEDGKEMGIPLDVGKTSSNIGVSQDGKWIGEIIAGKVRVWNAESYEKVIEFDGGVSSLGISPDAMKIVTGLDDFSASIWSLSTGQRLLGPLEHNSLVSLIKFSPDGLLLATAARSWNSIRIYDSRDGRLFDDFPVQLPDSFSNQSIAWTGDSKHLFALSHDSKIYYLDVYSGSTGSHSWSCHSEIDPTCISLSGDGTFIAVSAGSSVSFWDTTTHEPIGNIIYHPARVTCMSISPSYDLVTSGGTKISLWDLSNILPSPYSENVQRSRADAEIARSKYMYDQNIESTIEELRSQLADSQSVAKQTEDSLEEAIKSLRTNLRSLKVNSENLENTVEEVVAFQLKTVDLIHQLRTKLSNAQQKTDSLTKVLDVHQQKCRCEYLYSDGRVVDAAASLLEVMRKEGEDMISDWLPVFRNKCVARLRRLGDEAAELEKFDDALLAYSTALSLSPCPLDDLLRKWVGTMLVRSPPNDVRDAATELKIPKFNISRTICDVLEEGDHIEEAIEYFQDVQAELAADANIHNVHARWELGFQRRCMQKLEKEATNAMESQNYEEAAEMYSTVLSLDTADRVDALIKRSKAQVMMKSWEDALNDAREAIQVDESLSCQGPEQSDEDSSRRQAEAAETFEAMLRKLLKKSLDERVCVLKRYIYCTIPTRPTFGAG